MQSHVIFADIFCPLVEIFFFYLPRRKASCVLTLEETVLTNLSTYVHNAISHNTSYALLS